MTVVLNDLRKSTFQDTRNNDSVWDQVDCIFFLR